MKTRTIHYDDVEHELDVGNKVYVDIDTGQEILASLKRKKYTSQVKVNQILGCSFEDSKCLLKSSNEQPNI